jgi:[ribosomal protein S5]-alanine N-acetyltransferase
MIIETVRLRLELQAREKLLAMYEGHPEVSPEWLARVRAATELDPWLFGYAVIERGSGAVVGSAGFTGAPGADGVVEIAYGIDGEYQRRGYATEAAGALVGYAFGSDRVRVVRAHTLPASNASTRVLEKCGFERVGEVVDLEDGLVWRWECRQTAG